MQSSLNPTDRELLRTVMDRLAGLPDALRQTLTDSLWQSIAGDNWESTYAAVTTANVPLQIAPKTTLPMRVECIVASVPSGATGIIQLGDVTIPVGAGIFNANGLRLQISQTDIRQITTTGTGPVSLLITGVQLPTYGAMTR